MTKKQEGTTDRNEITSALYTIANVAHAEYHIIELMVNNNKDDKKDVRLELVGYMGKLRTMRSEMMKDLAVYRPAMNGLWCVMKHLILTEMHFWELFEKEGKTYYLDCAKEIHMMMDTMLANDDFGNLEDCPRCDTDKKTK